MLIQKTSTACLLLIACVIAHADECTPQEPSLAELRELLKSSPEDLALNEAKLKAPRFYAVQGYGATIVGLEPKLANCAQEKGYYKLMPGTSDNLCTNEILNLQPSANAFAKRYNIALAKNAHIQCP